MVDLAGRAVGVMGVADVPLEHVHQGCDIKALAFVLEHMQAIGVVGQVWPDADDDLDAVGQWWCVNISTVTYSSMKKDASIHDVQRPETYADPSLMTTA